MKILDSFTAAVVAVFALFTTSAAHAVWNRPLDAKGHLFVYISNAGLKGLVVTNAIRARELLAQTLSSSRIHLFTDWDYENGKVRQALERVADKNDGEPIDMFTLTHSSGAFLSTPEGASLKNWLAQIPAALKPRLRTFMNTGCVGAQSNAAAINAGFAVASGSRDTSFGPILLDEFLNYWLQGVNVEKASAYVNWSCRHSATWGSIFLITRALGMFDSGDSQDDYCRENGDLEISERFPGAAQLTIQSELPRAKN